MMRKKSLFFIAVGILGLVLFKILVNYLYRAALPPVYRPYCEKYARVYQLDYRLIYAVMKVESRFDPDAISVRGAIGLMQLMPKTAKYLAEKLKIENFNRAMIYDIETNIRLGCFYLSKLRDHFNGDINFALAAYNCGLGKIKKWKIKEINQIPYPETRNFVKKVLRNYTYIKTIEAIFNFTELKFLFG